MKLSVKNSNCQQSQMVYQGCEVYPKHKENFLNLKNSEYHYIHTLYCSIEMVERALVKSGEILVVVHLLDAEIKRYLKAFLCNLGNQ